MPSYTSNMRNAQHLARGEKSEWFEVLAAELQTTADRTSQEFSHPTSPGIMMKVVLGNEAGAFSATVNIQTPDADGSWTTVYTSAALTANGTTLFLVYPGGGTNSLFTIVPFVMPRTWRVFLDYSATPASDKADTRIQACYL